MSDQIGRMTSNVERENLSGVIPPENVNTLGAKFWKLLTYTQKRSYLDTTGIVIKDNIDSDYHLGDANFQSRIIGFTDQYITLVGSQFSDYYTELDDKKGTFEFPEKLKDMIYTSKSSFNAIRLLENTSEYLVKVENRREVVKPDPYAKAIIFKHWDNIWKGIRAIGELEPEQQQELILQGLAPNTNSGYPFFNKQTKTNFPKMWGNFLQQFLGNTYVKHRVLIKDGTSLTVECILDAVREARVKRYFPPYILFYRTQGGKHITKIRSVFGGDVLQKALGSLWSAGKTQNKELVKYGGLSWVAWDEWDSMFGNILDLLPDIDDEGYIVPREKQEIIEKHGETGKGLPDGLVTVDVYGEDFSGYDQSIIRGDLDWITSHRHVGWIMGYILDLLEHSEVWVGNMRISGIFFKSGMPFTSEFGSIIHLNIMANAAHFMNAVLLTATCLSDDNLAYWYNFDEKKYLEYCRSLGFVIDPAKSSWFSRDKIVSFLKVLVGYVFDVSYKSFIGDPQSRYYGLAHSEREFSGQFGTSKVKAEVRDLWEITGDVELDAFLSKLGSFAETGATLVLAVLNAVKHTDLGRRAIKAIANLPASSRVRPYRSDLFVSFRPTWLGKLDIQGLTLNEFSN